MAKISVVINTLNEEKGLPHVIASVKEFADEIVVCDMESTDSTVKVAKGLGAKVFSHPRIHYVEPARNFAVAKATGEWILILDVDETIPKTLQKHLLSIIKTSKNDYFRLPRKNLIFGKWIKHSRWWPDYNIRFFKKGHVSWNEVIHAVPMTQGRGADIPAKEALAIIHDNYPTIEIYFERMNRYTGVQSKLLIEGGYKFDWRDLIKKPLSEFLGRYFKGEGYKDGIHGLALAGLQAFSELALYLKVWQEGKFGEESPDLSEIKKEFQSAEKEVNWWLIHTTEKGIVGKVKKKLLKR